MLLTIAGSGNTCKDVKEDNADVTDFYHHTAWMWQSRLPEERHEENNKGQSLGVHIEF